MLTEFTFTLMRLRYLAAAAQNIPTFKPDGKDLAYINSLLTDANTAEAEFLTKFTEYNTANGALEAEFQDSHDAAVTVYACMKSCYRSIPSCFAAIRRLPKQDKSPEQTLKRMRGLTACWSTLPSLPGTTDPFTVGALTYLAFGTMAQTLETKITAADLTRTIYAGEQARLNEFEAQWNNFISAALIQGRAQYKPGTPERAYIDRVPTEPSTQEPQQAIITVSTNPAPGIVHLEFGALHATSFEVWHKGPSDPLFVLAADVLLPGIYDASGLPAGAHEYKIVGGNSRGEGPASEPVTVTVAVAAAA